MKLTHFSQFRPKKVNFEEKSKKSKKNRKILFFFRKNDHHKKFPKIISKLRRNILKIVLDRYGFPVGDKTILNARISTYRKVSHLKSTKGRFLGKICVLFDF